MIVCGIRCSNTDYSCCILEGDADSPQMKALHHVDFPKDYGEAEALRWFYQEMQGLFKEYAIDALGIKKAETNVRRGVSFKKFDYYFSRRSPNSSCNYGIMHLELSSDFLVGS